MKLMGVDWPVPPKLKEIIEAHMIPGGCVINFRDPNYSPVMGGYHPVEIMINKHGDLRYLTDFSYVGRPPYEELAKELDFDFGCARFTQMSRDYDIKVGRELFGIYCDNFCSYYASGVYEVTVEEL